MRTLLCRAFVILLSVRDGVALAHAECGWWYETTLHGDSFRNVRDYGAQGDGIHDDTVAIQAAFDSNQTGNGGSNLAKSPRIVYMPPGDYLISDTLVMWYYAHLVGNPMCPPTIRLAPNSAGFVGLSLKPVIVSAGGFNVTTASHAWWLQVFCGAIFVLHIRPNRYLNTCYPIHFLDAGLIFGGCAELPLL
jgi:hypothetical protein